MHIGRINKKFYEGYEEYDYVAFKIKEEENTALILWDGYIDSMLEAQKEWKAGLSLDWCEESGPYGTREVDVEVDIETYLNDLNDLDANLFSERLFTKDEVVEAYKAIVEFVKYAKKNNLTLLVNVGIEY